MIRCFGSIYKTLVLMCRYPESSINPKHPFPQRYPKINSSAHVKWLNCFLNLMTEFKFMNVFFLWSRCWTSFPRFMGSLSRTRQLRIKPESWRNKQGDFVTHGEIKIRTDSMEQLGKSYLQSAKEDKKHTSHLTDICWWHRMCIQPIVKPTPGPTTQ